MIPNSLLVCRRHFLPTTTRRTGLWLNKARLRATWKLSVWCAAGHCAIALQAFRGRFRGRTAWTSGGVLRLALLDVIVCDCAVALGVLYWFVGGVGGCGDDVPGVYQSWEEAEHY